METKENRINRILARGEVSDHCHVITGDAVVKTEFDGKRIIEVGDKGAVLKHLIESHWVESGTEKWTHEHNDIPLKKGNYEFIQQIEYDPYSVIKKRKIND